MLLPLRPPWPALRVHQFAPAWWHERCPPTACMHLAGCFLLSCCSCQVELCSFPANLTLCMLMPCMLMHTRPAVYMIGAAMPQECAQSILDATNGTTASEAELPERFGWALQASSMGHLGTVCRARKHARLAAPHLVDATACDRLPRVCCACSQQSARRMPSQYLCSFPAIPQDCYRNSADLSEALRCLYALPMLGVLADPSGGDVAEVGANHTAVQLLTKSTLPWLFGNTTNGTALSIRGEPRPGARTPGLCAACVGVSQALGQGVPTANGMPGPYWIADGTAQLAVAAAVARCLLHRVMLGLHSTFDVPPAAHARCRLQHGAHQRWQAALLGALHRRDQVRRGSRQRPALAGAGGAGQQRSLLPSAAMPAGTACLSRLWPSPSLVMLVSVPSPSLAATCQRWYPTRRG